MTRNSSTDLTDFKTRNEKRKVYNALAAASIFKNSAGVDTSRRQVVPMDAFLHFLSHFQKEQLSEEEVKQLIEVRLTWILQILSIREVKILSTLLVCFYLLIFNVKQLEKQHANVFF